MGGKCRSTLFSCSEYGLYYLLRQYCYVEDGIDLSLHEKNKNELKQLPLGHQPNMKKHKAYINASPQEYRIFHI